MYNKKFEYLLKNKPDEVISKKGIIARKVIHPLYLKLIPLTTSCKLDVINKGNVKINKPIIYAGTHGFRDDIVYSLQTIDSHAYLLYGSIPDFYESIDGYALWLNGTIIVDRKDKDSRKAAIEKMKYALDLGANVLMFPEGVWNKEESLIVQKLYTGIYYAAKEAGAYVVPVATYQIDGKGYSIKGEPFDITELTKENCNLIFDKIRKNLIKIKDISFYDDLVFKTIREKINNIIESLDFYQYNDLSIPIDEKIIDFIISTCKRLLEFIQYRFSDNYWNSLETYDKEIKESVLNEIKILLKDTIDTKARVCTNVLRDKMATLKWQLISEHSKSNRSDYDEYENISDYWNEHLDALIETANGFYDHEIEDVAEYKDLTETSEEEVFNIVKSKNEHVVRILKK